jgi:adenylate cyclase class 2
MRMATEIETKLRVADPNAIRVALDRLQARPAGCVFEVNRLFDTPDHRLQRADCGLRVREQRCLDQSDPPAPAASLTYKGPRQRGEVKMREELETAIADAGAVADILARLGFQQVILYEKRREIWRLGACEVSLDELPRLGWWLEVEGLSVEAVSAVIQQLRLAETPPTWESYVEMAAARGDLDATGGRSLTFDGDK